MKEAYLYKKLTNKQVQCLTCNHRCRILDGKKGICGIRENRGGKLYLLTYGLACAENIDPIEKKPFYHFLPGTQTLTIATVGCNFRCLWCQNYDISQAIKHSESVTPNVIDEMSSNLLPEKIVEDAISNNCPSISYSYTEPTVYLEYVLDTMKLAKKAGLKNIWVSNGYMTKETLKLILPYLDAANVDIKVLDKKKAAKFCGFTYPEKITDNCQTLLKNKVHLEVTTLIIPSVNDSTKELAKIASFIYKKLGPEIPWHLSRYHPAYKMNQPATSLETLQKAEKIGQKAGLKNIYLGNI